MIYRCSVGYGGLYVVLYLTLLPHEVHIYPYSRGMLQFCGNVNLKKYVYVHVATLYVNAFTLLYKVCTGVLEVDTHTRCFFDFMSTVLLPAYT
jgi:hypothetical protein